MKKWIAFLLTLTLMFVFIGCGDPVEEDPDKEDPIVEDVLPSAIVITNGVATMDVGETKTLTIEITPSTTTNQSVTWKSSNEAVVRVDSAGGLTALTAGLSTITVTSKAKSSIKVTLEITVSAVHVDVESVTISGRSEVEVGKSITLGTNVLPKGASTEVTFSSGNIAIATIDANGKVTGVAEGTVTITATKEITVTAASTEDPNDPVTKPTSIIVDGLSSVTAGYPTRYSASAYPEGADQSVTWHSRKEDIATITSKGVLTGIAEGTTYIYAISVADPTVQSDYFKVSVKPDETSTLTYPDLQGYVISIMNAASELEGTNPFTDSYTASDKMAKQKAWTDSQTLYNCTIRITAYPDEAPWGAARYDWINAQAAAGTPQADFYVVSAEWLPRFVNGNAAHDVSEFFDRFGR
ncbi:MAG TPA: Ig-like domain-containing protein, partial [Bacilli bacterium]|nr:Ig-like domain-containing protein [Bacilli bacterium]